MDNSKSVLVFIALVVVVSGCTDVDGNGTVSSNDALMVSEFSANPAEIYDNQDTSLRLTLMNSGDAEATDVRATLFNIPIGSAEEGKWEMDSRTLEYGDLRSGDPEAGVSPDETWRVKTLTPPDLDSGITTSSTIMTWITYGYETVGTTEIQLMSQRRYTDTGASRSTPEVDNSAAPIQLEVQTQSPIVYYGQEDLSSDLRVVVRNEGDGAPYLGESFRDSTENRVELEVEAAGSIDITPVDGDNSVDLVANEGRKTYRVSGIDFNADEDIQETIPVTIRANYRYYIEDETAVTVKGTRDGSWEDESDDGSDDDFGEDVEWSWNEENLKDSVSDWDSWTSRDATGVVGGLEEYGCLEDGASINAQNICPALEEGSTGECESGSEIPSAVADSYTTYYEWAECSSEG